MTQKLIIILFLLKGIYFDMKSQNIFRDYHPPKSMQKSITSSSTSKNSINGLAFSPKGDLRILILCVGFGMPFDNNECSGWPVGENTLPDMLNNNSLFYNNYSDFDSNTDISKGKLSSF